MGLGRARFLLGDGLDGLRDGLLDGPGRDLRDLPEL